MSDLRKIVEIQVQFEDENKTFPVPIELLNFGAPNFAKLFPHPNVRAIKIEDVSVKTFDIFLGWLITGYLCEPTHDSDAIREWFRYRNDGLFWIDANGDPIFRKVSSENGIWEIAEAAIEMYIFARVYDIPRLRCDAMDRLVGCNNTAHYNGQYGTFVSASSITRAYEHIDPGSPLRELLISGFFWFFSSDGEKMVDLPRPYLIDIAVSFKSGKLTGDRDDGYRLPGCYWHEHETEEERTGCKIRVNMDRPVVD